MKILKVMGFIVITQYAASISYAQDNETCNAVATFNTQTGELIVPCLRVDNGSFYEISLLQRTSSTFTLSTYKQLGDALPLSPEIDPIWEMEKDQYVKSADTSNWDKDATDDFNGNFHSLTN